MNVELLIVDIPKYFFSFSQYFLSTHSPFHKMLNAIVSKIECNFSFTQSRCATRLCDDDDDDDHGDDDHGDEDHGHGDHGHGDLELERTSSPNPGVRGDFCQALHHQHQPGRGLYGLF